MSADILAEQYVLGACLNQPATAVSLLAVAEPSMFVKPGHATIAAVIGAMCAEGLDVNPVTVLQRLTDNGEAQRVGGGPYLIELMERWMPGVGSVQAERIREAWWRRSIEEKALRLAQRAENPATDLSPLMGELAGLLDALDGHSGRTPYVPPDLDSLMERDDAPDWLAPGLLERMERAMITGFEGLGKALALDTPIPTPKGWTTMGALSVGDEVFAPDGTPTRVIAATETMTDRPCYRVRFSDGAEIVADANHLWRTETLAARGARARYSRRGAIRARGTDQQHKRIHFPEIVTTEHIAGTVHARDGHALNHSVEVCAPLEFPKQELSIPPYVLGAWLGDGASHYAGFTCADEEIVEVIRSYGQPCRKGSGPYYWSLSAGHGGPRATTLSARLRALGLLGNKHIPEAYQVGSVGQRLALLQGLMDTDGTIGGNPVAPTCEFSVTSERLAEDVYRLLLGLGVKVAFRSGPAKLNGRTVGTRYRLAFQTELPVFRLKRKAEKLVALPTMRARLRYIESAEPVESVPVRCIQVERADGMFVAGEQCIPTHNSELTAQLAVCMAAGLHPFTLERFDPLRVLVVDLENGWGNLRRRYGRHLAAVEAILGSKMDRSRLMVESRDAGLDLTRADDQSWLDRALSGSNVDVLCIGALYKMHRSNMNDESAARTLTAFLDDMRARHGVAIVIEAHAGQATDGAGSRLLRPRGSSLFLGWPNVGFGLRPHPDCQDAERPERVEVKSWRGQREDRDWPRELRRGFGHGQLPWMPVTDADRASYSSRRTA